MRRMIREPCGNILSFVFVLLLSTPGGVTALPGDFFAPDAAMLPTDAPAARVRSGVTRPRTKAKEPHMKPFPLALVALLCVAVSSGIARAQQAGADDSVG